MKPYFLSLLIMIMLLGCVSQSTSESTLPEPTFTPSMIPATATLTSTLPPPTATVIPTSTPLPGVLVLPVDTLGETIPWLPLDESARPASYFVGFNTLQPPFNSALVRQAFASAIDRQVIADMATKYAGIKHPPATTLTTPETLGRDLYNVVGMGFDPQRAKDLLLEAGYTDPSAFPTVTIVVNAYGDIAPGARFNMASTMAEMWKTHLGVSVEVEVIQKFKDYGDRLKTNPPEIFWFGWVADVNDPDNFLREIFHSTSQYNYGRFSSPEFDQLVESAADINDPAQRQALYILAERLLCEQEAALIPLYH